MNLTIPKKQRIAIGAVVLLGVVLAGLILGTKPSSQVAPEPAKAEQPNKPNAGKEHVEPSAKVVLTSDQIKAAGIAVLTAGPAQIQASRTLPGEIRFNEDRLAHVVPRLAGVVERVAVTLGQQVRRGDVLAVIASTGLAEQRSELLAAQKRLALAKLTFDREKKLWEERISAEQDFLQAQQAFREAEIAVQNAAQKLAALGAPAASNGALNRFEIRAPFDGTVIEKHVSLGEAVKEDASIFTIADLATVWAEVAVAAQDLAGVRVGQKVSVKASAFEASAPGTIAYLGPLLGEQTRTAKARITLANRDGTWRPGLIVNVELQSGQVDVPVAVDAEGVHQLGEQTVVFVRDTNGFVAQPVQTGRTDTKRIEITSGLKAGAVYAGAGSFVIKSELGKSSADEDH